MKRAIVDASSFIILHRAGLLPVLVEMYNVILAASVYQEITANAYSGADVCEHLVNEKKIRVENVAFDTLPHNLDRGEAETIQLHKAGHGDFIITDDGAAARFCTQEKIPFINALLFPVALKHTGNRTADFCNIAFETILKIGRYSGEVINFASQCEREEIYFVFP